MDRQKPEQQRLDQWLWRVRMFKSRGLASVAIRQGKVSVNDGKAKSSRPISAGDRIAIERSGYRQQIEVISLASRRGSFREASLHYRESNASIASREAAAVTRRNSKSPAPEGRPDKRQRRQIHRFTGKGRAQ